MESLADAEHKELIEPESRMMLEGVIRMADMTAGDVMVPSKHMDLLDIDAPYEEMLHVIIRTGHSRFPVFEERRDNIDRRADGQGSAEAAALAEPEACGRCSGRRSSFPSRSALNELLRDFRTNRNHIAIVIDEFGHTAGLLTLEDVLEEIVGEIEDEFDESDAESSIYTLADGSQRVAGDATVAAVNEAFDVMLPTDEFDTIGGLVAARARPRAAARRVGDDRRPRLRGHARARRRRALVQGDRAPAEEALGSDGA